ncbi:tail fiber domain-containing protein [Arthrobacter sp. BPSS-3]|uniref:tail fiber domain-containing protein n=1 Tax=Arthrobacter sp. BPSS-3 TaxID=3366580 RepID=UPI0037DCB357
MPQPGKPSVAGEDFLVRKVQDLERTVKELAAANIFGPMGIKPRKGGINVLGFVNSLREDGTVGVSMDDDGVFVVYDAAGTTPVARFGPLDNSAPGQYGVEVLVGTTWVQIGAQTTTWSTVSGKPDTYPPAAHKHVGADITSGTVPQADGSQYGWTNNVAGTSFYQVWVGNDGGYHFGRNTSSIQYKENVRAHNTDPANVLALQPVIYDRIDGGTNEYGLIAEQVAEHFPELVIWFDGKIDGLRYDLLPVALLDVVRDQENRIRALEGKEPLPARPTVPNVPASGAPAEQPQPLPFDIQETP